MEDNLLTSAAAGSDIAEQDTPMCCLFTRDDTQITLSISLHEICSRGKCHELLNSLALTGQQKISVKEKNEPETTPGP